MCWYWMLCGLYTGGWGGGPVNHHSMAAASAKVDHLIAVSGFLSAQDELVGGTNLSSVSMESAERRQFITEIQALSKLVATEYCNACE